VTIVLHHLEKSRSHRVLWLLEELGVPYEVKRYARHPRTMRADPALKAIFPLGRAPIVEIDGVALAESGAILEGLLDRVGEGRLRPEQGSRAFDHYRFFLHYAEGSLMPPLLVSLILSKMVSGVPFVVRPLMKGVVAAVNHNFTNGEFEAHFGFVERHLGDHEWFAGDALTAADIQMSYPMEAGALRAGLTPAAHPNVFRWLEQARSRAAYRRAIEVGGPLFP
jgi:glutathione S-transferase